MVDQFVFGLERPSIPGAALPVARVVGLLGAPHVLHCYVSHNLVHRGENFVAGLLGLPLVLVHPQAGVLLLDGVPHKRVKRPRPVGAHVHPVVAHGVHVVQVLRRAEVVRPRGPHLVELVRSVVREHLPVDVVPGARVRETGEQNVTSRCVRMVWGVETHTDGRRDPKHTRMAPSAVVAWKIELLRPAYQEIAGGVAGNLRVGPVWSHPVSIGLGSVLIVVQTGRGVAHGVTRA